MRILQLNDVLIEDHGSIVTFKILTNYAKAWVDEHVHTEPWQWRGAELFVDGRPAKALIAAISSELNVSRDSMFVEGGQVHDA